MSSSFFVVLKPLIDVDSTLNLAFEEPWRSLYDWSLCWIVFFVIVRPWFFAVTNGKAKSIKLCLHQWNNALSDSSIRVFRLDFSARYHRAIDFVYDRRVMSHSRNIVNIFCLHGHGPDIVRTTGPGNDFFIYFTPHDTTVKTNTKGTRGERNLDQGWIFTVDDPTTTAALGYCFGVWCHLYLFLFSLRCLNLR